MKRTVAAFMIGALATVIGCSANQGKELLETARFEEKQHNREHAMQLYEEIVRKYPHSEAAGQAGERLEQLKKEKP